MHFARLLPLALMAGLSACTTVHAGSQAEAYRDPWEHTNRDLYAFNKGLDKYALKPVTQVYRTVTPVAARHGVSNVFNNIDEPLSFINAILQGKIKQAFRTADRFLLNTTLGVGGLADVATDMGRPEEPEDFGQTLAVWGVGTGPYLMVPLLGPSTARDLTGFVVDFFTDPVGYGRNSTIGGGIEIRGGQFAAEVIDLRSKIIDAQGDEILAGSLDEYATVKSAYLQRRQNLIYDGNPPEDEELPPLPATPATAAPDAPAPVTPK